MGPQVGLWEAVIVAVAALIVSTLIFLASRYKRCPSDKILVVYGRVGKGVAARCTHGGGLFVWPLIQGYSFLSLAPITIDLPLQNALSQQNIRINVPSTFKVGVSTDKAIRNNAVERLLNLKSSSIEEMAKEIIVGQLRLTVASLTIEQINQDCEGFLDAIRKNVEPELNKIGLYLISINIPYIADESYQMEGIGNTVEVDVAEQE